MLPFLLIPIGVLAYYLMLDYLLTNAGIEEEITAVDDHGELITITFIRKSAPHAH